MKEQPRLRNYLLHIEEAIEAIFTYTNDIDETAFLQNRLVQDAVIRNFEVIGEASRNITQRYCEYAEQHPELGWSDMVAMRNRIAHGYFSIDLEIVWRTIERDLPELEENIIKLLEELENDETI
jgi:uncharacterized protein with HEPN domain